MLILGIVIGFVFTIAFPILGVIGESLTFAVVSLFLPSMAGLGLVLTPKRGAKSFGFGLFIGWGASLIVAVTSCFALIFAFSIAGG
jgi:hypothetical protein